MTDNLSYHVREVILIDIGPRFIFGKFLESNGMVQMIKVKKVVSKPFFLKKVCVTYKEEGKFLTRFFCAFQNHVLLWIRKDISFFLFHMILSEKRTLMLEITWTFGPKVNSSAI